MALQKAKLLANGVTGNYWKITSVLYDRIAGIVHYEISLFLDQAHGQANEQNLGLKKLFIFEITKDQGIGNLVSFGYTNIKTKSASMIKPIGWKQGDALIEFDADLSGIIDV